EEGEGPRLRLRGDRGERAQYEERRLVRHQTAMQRPPSSEWIAPHLKRNHDVDERAVDEILRDRGDRDRPWLAHHLRAGTRDEKERCRRGARREHGGGRVEP